MYRINVIKKITKRQIIRYCIDFQFKTHYNEFLFVIILK